MSSLKPLSIINCYLPFNTELDEHLKSSNFIVIVHLLVPELKWVEHRLYWRLVSIKHVYCLGLLGQCNHIPGTEQSTLSTPPLLSLVLIVFSIVATTERKHTMPFVYTLQFMPHQTIIISSRIDVGEKDWRKFVFYPQPKWSCGKVMFSEACVILTTGIGVYIVTIVLCPGKYTL